MARILAVQGSPRPKSSNTDALLQEFLKGARSQGAETETVYLQEKNIHPCVGCYTCWTKTPGICVFKDDMPGLLEKVRDCDILVYATPLYNYSMTSYLKIFKERNLPLLEPYLVKEGQVYRHPQRYPNQRKMVLVSTCGFPEISHFDALRHIFRKMEKSGVVPLIGELLVPAAELALRQAFLKEKARVIFEAAYRAGIEVVREGKISPETEAKVQEPLLPADEVAEMANIWWDSMLQGNSLEKAADAGKKVEDIRLVLLGMARMFNPQASGNLKAIIQFEVTGKQPGNWFFSIADGQCSFEEGKGGSPNLTIQTPSEVWVAIANKELDGAKAFVEGKYTAKGDMGLMIKMKKYFGGEE
ncbi:MAG TPA: NAD(P)H-dependent oxidoreductase [Thermodesulfobacteriota bacterium]|nr:NAD(P)H-dependent oxidoreductase [Thermodesulfobacteriota bacterium]